MTRDTSSKSGSPASPNPPTPPTVPPPAEAAARFPALPPSLPTAATPPPTPTLGVGHHSLASLNRLAQLDNNIDPIVMGGPLQYTINEVAELTGTTRAQIQDFIRWLGRPPREPEDIFFTEADVEIIKYAAHLARTEHLSYTEMGSLVRGISSALDRLSMRQVQAIVRQLSHGTNISDTEARVIAAEFAPSRAAMMLPLVEHIWRRQYASAVRRLTTNAIAQRGLYGDDRDYPLLRAVGFADIVDFTARTEDMTAHEFTEFIRDFTNTCWDIITDHGGRVVNFIGDAVFFVADNVEIGAEVALGLAAPGALGHCGPVRTGLVWTRVVAAYGDVFGPGVNLAARISSAADPDEVFIGPAVTAHLSRNPKYVITAQPAFKAHGIGTVQPNRLRHADDSRNEFEEKLNVPSPSAPSLLSPDELPQEDRVPRQKPQKTK